MANRLKKFMNLYLINNSEWNVKDRFKISKCLIVGTLPINYPLFNKYVVNELPSTHNASTVK